MPLLTKRVDGAVAAGFCGYEYARPKRICEGHIGQHPTTLPRTRRSPLIDDHEFVPVYYVPMDERWPTTLIVERSGRLRPSIRAALRDAGKLHRRRVRLELLDPEREPRKWEWIDDLRLPFIPPYIHGPFRLRLRKYVMSGMFRNGRMNLVGETRATFWPDGTVALDDESWGSDEEGDR